MDLPQNDFNMKIIKYNDLESCVLQSFEQIECFQNIQGEKDIVCHQKGDYCYVIFLKDVKMHLQFFIENSNIKIKIFGIVLPESKVNDLTFSSVVKSSECCVDMNFVVLQSDNLVGTLDWKVIIEPHIENVEASLMEQVLLLGEHISSITKPSLYVSSPDVKAFHGTKIQKISEETLFYLASRWIGSKRAKQCIIDSYMNQALQTILLSESEKNQIYSFFW